MSQPVDCRSTYDQILKMKASAFDRYAQLVRNPDLIALSGYKVASDVLDYEVKRIEAFLTDLEKRFPEPKGE